MRCNSRARAPVPRHSTLTSPPHPTPTSPNPQAACTDKESNPGGYSCAQQKAWGKCSEAWLAGKCDATCGKCTAKTGLEAAKEAPEGAEQDTFIAGLATAAKLKKNGTWLWKKNMTLMSLEADSADLAAPQGVNAAIAQSADGETLMAGAIAAKLLALKKNSTWLAAKFNKTKFAAEDVDAVEKADDADTLIAGMAIASKLAKLNKTGLLAAKFNKTKSADAEAAAGADDEVLLSSAVTKVLRLKNATKFGTTKNWTKFVSDEVAQDVPELEVRYERGGGGGGVRAAARGPASLPLLPSDFPPSCPGGLARWRGNCALSLALINLWTTSQTHPPLPPSPPSSPQANDYHLLKSFNKSWATSALATKFNLTAIAAAKKNLTLKGL